MDLRQSDLWAEYMRSIGWQAEKIQDHFLYTYGFLIFKFAKIPRFTPKLDLAWTDQQLKKKGILLVKLEPDFGLDEGISRKLNVLGFKQDSWALAPTKTITIDLTVSEDTLFKNLEKDTRYSIRLAQRKNVIVKETNNFEEFYPLYKQTSKRGGFWIESKSNLQKRWEIFSTKGKAKIFTAFVENVPLATAMIYYWEKTAYYLYAASSSEKRSHMAPYLLLWHIIVGSKENGLKKLDLEGIFDARIPVTRDWKGFTHFKKGFGGQEISSQGSFTKIYNPVFRALFTFADRFWQG